MATKPNAAKRGESPARAPAKTPIKPVAVPGGAQTSEDAKFDRLVYERVRLGIMSAQEAREAMAAFMEKRKPDFSKA